jgi:hypothetical protein
MIELLHKLNFELFLSLGFFIPARPVERRFLVSTPSPAKSRSFSPIL